MTLRQWTDDTMAEVLGREHRTDPVLPGGGGPATIAAHRTAREG